MELIPEPSEEPKDRTKLIWLGVLVLFGALVAVMWVASRQRADVTTVRVKHILIKCAKDDPVARARAIELLNDLRSRILKGESFAKLAREYSNDESSAARGGDLGYYPRHAFDAGFEDYVWSGPVGELSDIIQTTYGFHLVVVVDRHISAVDQYEMDLEKKARETQKDQKPEAASPAPAP